jgi:hypothetical protein
MNSNLEKMQSLLDDNKQSIGDDLYLKMCELNKAQFDQNKNCFYKVTYCVSIPSKISTNDYYLDIQMKNAIVQIPEENYLHILSKISGCQHDLVFCSLFEQLPKFSCEMISSYYSECCAEAVCDCDGYTKTTIECKPKIISIVKL